MYGDPKQADLYVKDQQTNHQSVNKETLPVSFQLQKGGQLSDTDLVKDDLVKVQFDDATEDAPEIVDAWDGNSLLRRSFTKIMINLMIW